ncbi:MAG TPA: sensor histidine kinase [Terriglobales bacterium]|nr:sensor histidine kinase [Terriglobales bacterium]
MATDTSLSTKILETTGMGYAVALFATLLALLLRLGLNPFLGEDVPYITLLPAVAFCAWYCGIGPSIVSVAVALLGAQYWFIPPIHSLRVFGLAQVIGILLFLSASTVLLAMGESRRRHEQVLWAAQRELGVAVNERTAELDRSNQNLRELSARLMQLQDDERRRIARELHDSVGQMLAALGMNLATVGTDIERLTKTASTINDSAALVQELSREVRTISHLLHPPLLDEAGLASALHWYVDGFAERSKIKVDLEIPAGFERLARESETAIFRTVQECLTNIHRHSGSPTAKIRIATSDGHICVEVEDRGKGIPSEKQFELASTGTPGVGIRGMRERLRQLGGSLDIHSNGKGTVIVARLPVAVTSVTPAAA